jgi:catechol 2,3-dioxygenase-like lactoylglutathione lyase family enzyme
MPTTPQFETQSRVHMGLEVTDLEASVAFYTRLFQVEPTKRRPGYARFEVSSPALNLSLNEVSAARRPKPLASHFGVQLRDAAALEAVRQRLEDAGLVTRVQQQTTCCYAVQDKVWVHDPDGVPWEWYRVTDDDADAHADSDGACCAPQPATGGCCG